MSHFAYQNATDEIEAYLADRGLADIEPISTADVQVFWKETFANTKRHIGAILPRDPENRKRQEILVELEKMNSALEDRLQALARRDMAVSLVVHRAIARIENSD